MAHLAHLGHIGQWAHNHIDYIIWLHGYPEIQDDLLDDQTRLDIKILICPDLLLKM